MNLKVYKRSITSYQNKNGWVFIFHPKRRLKSIFETQLTFHEGQNLFIHCRDKKQTQKGGRKVNQKYSPGNRNNFWENFDGFRCCGMSIYESIVEARRGVGHQATTQTKMADTVMLNFNNRYNNTNGSSSGQSPNKCNGECHRNKFSKYESQGL